MSIPSAPVRSAVTDPARLATLRRLGLPGTHAEAFDRLARLAAAFLDVPMTLISLVEVDGQVLAGAFGLPEPRARSRDVPAAFSYCGDVVERGEPLVIEDAREDAHFRESAVLREFGVVAYLGIPIVSADGHLLGAFCALDRVPRRWSATQVELLADLTASAMTEVELRQEALERAAADRRGVQILEHITDAFYAVDAEWRFTYVNREAELRLHRSREELLGAPLWEAFPDLVGSLFEQEYRRAVAERVAVSFEAYYPAPLDSWYAVHAYPSAEGLSAYFHEINERKHTEALLKASEAHYRRLATNVPLAVYVVDAEGHFGEINAAAERLLGRSSGELMGEPFDTVIGPERLPRVREAFRQIISGESDDETYEARVRRPSGEERLITITATAIRDGGQITGLHGIARDITDERAAAEALRESERHRRQAERLASLGTMVGGVAHELNNPLHAILNFSQLMLLDEHSADDREALEIIVREAERMAKIVSDLRRIARSTQDEAPERSAVDLNEIVRHVLRVQEYRLRTSNIDVREDLSADLPKVVANRAQLEQVVLNLVINAEQAMSAHAGRGQLILRTRASARGVVLHVVDTGPGIPAPQLARIFDPFYTTKSPGEGMGLGLSMVHSIISEHGGEVRVESEVGSGTAFAIELPLARAGHAERGSPAPETAEQGEGLRVLIVDDEASIRAVIARYLQRRGHTVDQASEGGAALDMLGRSAYDVIISDLRMPGLDGEAMLARLSVRGLASRVVFVTGDAAGAGAQLKQAGVPILHKPAKLAEIGRVVEEVGRRTHAA